MSDGMIPRRKLLGRSLPGSLVALVFIVIVLIVMMGANTYQPAEGLKFPALSGRVVDNADILSPAAEGQITALSEQLEQKTGAQFVVATLPDLQGTSIEDFGYQLGRAWQIGRKGYDDGVLLLVAPNDREVRIEVGYGLEPVLTDAASSVIIQNAIIPAFKSGDMEGGTLEGAKDIAALISDPNNKDALPAAGAVIGGDGGNIRPPGETGFSSDMLVFLLFGLIFGAMPILTIANWVRCLINPAYGAELVPMPRPSRFTPGGWGGGGRGGSGGGFSGGGGSFGGGGSSGSW